MSKQKQPTASQKALVTLSAVVALNMSDIPQAAAQSVFSVQPLVFGSLIACGVANPVTVTPTGTISSPNCARGGGPFNNGIFNVVGTIPPVPIQISLSSTFVNLGGPGTMKVSNFNLVTNAGGTATTITTFNATIPFGATLNVGGTQAAGVYSGTITFNANYM
ncbi:MAG: DUF4402 domain-containing protein [Pseudomonadota bacterium]